MYGYNGGDGKDYRTCYYYTQGGCPPELKPDICKHWYCDIWDEFVLGEVKPIRVWHQAKCVTRYLLYKMNEAEA